MYNKHAIFLFLNSSYCVQIYYCIFDPSHLPIPDPRVPALYGAPLVTPASKNVPEEAETVPSTDPSEQPSSKEGGTAEVDNTEGANQDDSSPVNANEDEESKNEEATVADATPQLETAAPSDTTDNATPISDSPTCDVSDQPLFPVIVYSHGMGSMRTTYTAICCDLASNGFVVGAMEHRYVFTYVCVCASIIANTHLK